MLLDFETQKEELESTREHISKACDELNEYAVEEWNNRLTIIQRDFMDFQNSFSDFNEQIPDLDVSVQSDAQKLYTKMNKEIHNLEVRINSLKKVGSPAIKENENTQDTSATQQHSLSSANDLSHNLNDLEAGKETNEADQAITESSCVAIKKTLMIASVVFIILGIICLIIFISC